VTKKLFWIILAACLVLGLGLGMTTRLNSGGAAREAATILPANDAWRAALPQDPAQATQAYMDRIPAAAQARSDAYFTGGYWIQLWSFLASMAIFWLLLATGASAAMRDYAERVTRRKPLQTMLYAAQFFVATTILGLPLGVATGFTREHRYGMTLQTFGPYMKEQVIGLVLSVILGSLVMAALYGVVRRCKQTWWMWGTCVAMVFMIFTAMIAPPLIDPLFNSYKPLPDGPVRQSILSLARANGVPAKDVYMFDASKQTNRVSANVSGLFGTTSIRLNDNLLNRCSLPEIKGVMAHEMGHYVLNHVIKSMVFFFLILAAGFAFAAWGFDWVSARFTAWGIRDVGDTAGLPLISALFAAIMFVMTPISNTIVRTQEMEADQFGANACLEPDGFAEAELKLIEYRKADPGPVEEFLFYDHPSPRKRILVAMRWKAEHAKELKGASDK
jgi:STE24 endopeptidase